MGNHKLFYTGFTRRPNWLGAWARYGALAPDEVRKFPVVCRAIGEVVIPKYIKYRYKTGELDRQNPDIQV